jgi:osmotically-inducible protein OsmY
MSTSAQDESITAAVQSAIANHRDLGSPNQIDVATRDHVVYLSGIVDSGLVRDNAKDVARQVDGVTRVVSNISVSR